MRECDNTQVDEYFFPACFADLSAAAAVPGEKRGGGGGGRRKGRLAVVLLEKVAHSLLCLLSSSTTVLWIDVGGCSVNNRNCPAGLGCFLGGGGRGGRGGESGCGGIIRGVVFMN